MALYKYAPESGATDVLTDAQYQASLDRRVGAQVGLADRALNNKALKQATLFLPAWARLIQEVTGDEVFDTMTEEQAYIALRSLFQPPGSLLYTFSNKDQPGHILGDGSNVSRTTYPNLFAYYGTTFGVGDGSTTFGLPDYRGVFFRATDKGKGIDPWRQAGTMQAGTLTSISLGTENIDTLCTYPEIDIPLTDYLNRLRADRVQSAKYLASQIGTIFTPSGTVTTSSTLSDFTKAGVTRPENIAVNVWIKY